MSSLKIVKGYITSEQIKSIDGLIYALDKKSKGKTPDEKLAQEVAELKQTVTVLLDHLGLTVDSGPKKVIRQVRLIEDETGTDHTL